jgi:hypothetical protein
MTRWRSQLQWTDDNETTYHGVTYRLHHANVVTGKRLGRGNGWESTWSRRPEYTLYKVENNCINPYPLSIALGGDRRVARRLAELTLLGWRNAPGYLAEGGREQWSDPAGELHPLDEVLDGERPH